MLIREHTQADLGQMITIWNEIVEEGIAFPQEECLEKDEDEKCSETGVIGCCTMKPAGKHCHALDLAACAFH